VAAALAVLLPKDPSRAIYPFKMVSEGSLNSQADVNYRRQTENIEYATERRDSFVPHRSFGTAAERARRNINAKLANPLAGYSHDVLRKYGMKFAIAHQMGNEEDMRAFEVGAVLAQAPEKFGQVQGLTNDELEKLRKEFSNRWSQPWLMYVVIVICSISAAVQGMGESVGPIKGTSRISDSI
jgi:hypothetical protein